MDTQERKLLAQLDGPARIKALDALLNYLAARGRSFRQIVFEDENSVPRQDYEGLAQQLAGYQRANAAAKAYNTALAAQNKVLRGMLWGQSKFAHLTRLQKAAVVSALLLGGFSWRHWPQIEAAWSPSAAARREAVAEAGRDLLERVPWISGRYAPVVFYAGRLPYWAMIRGDSDSERHTDAEGRPVVVHCLYLYAAPAAADAGGFLAPQPYSLFGVGWLQWPERAAECKVAGLVKEASQ
jgi:hypothetical protein